MPVVVVGSSGRIEEDDDDGDIVIAIDSTGIKVAKRPISDISGI
jgi:hypothetical protein